MFARARWRLVAAYSAILGVILIGLSFAVFTIFQDGLYNEVDQALETNASTYAATLADHAQITPGSCVIVPVLPQLEVAETTYYSVIDCNRQSVVSNWTYPTGVVPADMIRAMSNHTIIRTMQRDNNYWRVYSAPIEFGRPPRTSVIGAVQFYRPVDAQVNAVHRLELVLIGGGVGALAVAGIAGLFLAGRTLAPIRAAFDRQRKFIADASHELRTPLTLIRSSAEMVMTTSADRLDPEDGELLDNIVEEVDRLSQLVNDLLTLARADNAQIQLEPGPVDLAELVSQTHRDIEPLGRQKNLRNVVSDSDPQIVIGDELRLRQLLLILLDNAIKYTNSGGTVETSVARHDGRVEVTVRDSGVGISQAALPHVFDRFYRADGARTHEGGGAGLGLAIAAWIVRAHQGKIKISSTPGTGTQVTIELPAPTPRQKQ